MGPYGRVESERHVRKGLEGRRLDVVCVHEPSTCTPQMAAWERVLGIAAHALFQEGRGVNPREAILQVTEWSSSLCVKPVPEPRRKIALPWACQPAAGRAWCRAGCSALRQRTESRTSRRPTAFSDTAGDLPNLGFWRCVLIPALVLPGTHHAVLKPHWCCALWENDEAL